VSDDPIDYWRSAFVRATASAFASQRALAERAIAQLDERELFRSLGHEENSVAILMKHVGGNLHSRWTQPFTTDGEKPDRHRDAEFEATPDDGVSVRGVWQTGWTTLEQTLRALEPADFEAPLQIRGEPVTLLDALQRSLAHTAQHVGQLILLARHWRGAEWQTLSLPRRRPAPP
jgi:hypothetical protein